MNITEWLEDIAPASRPRLPKPIVQPAESLAVPREAANPVVHPSKKKLRSRKRSGADSSILEPDHTPPEVQHKSSHRQKRKVEHSKPSVSESDHAPSTNSVSQISVGGASEVYRRRKRYKTRADKYDLKHKRSRHNHADHNHQSKRAAKEKPRTKEKRKVIKGRTAAAVVQNFDAPNVQCERLTLQHVPNVGLFKRGRASSPFRGRGIPDLVFSEMNFLQNRKSLHDAGFRFENARAGRSKDKARQAEEEISAYFNPARPALQERDTNHVPRRYTSQLHKKRTVQSDQQSNVSATSITRRSVEPRHVDAGATRSKSASATYYTWSTSEAPDPQRISQSRSHAFKHGSLPMLKNPTALPGVDKSVSRRHSLEPQQRQTRRIAPKICTKKAKKGPVASPIMEATPRSRHAKEGARRNPRPDSRVRERNYRKLRETSVASLVLPSSPPRSTGHGLVQATVQSARSESLPRLPPRTTLGADAEPQSLSRLDDLLEGCNEVFAHRSSDIPILNPDDDDDSVMRFNDQPEEQILENQQPPRYGNNNSRSQEDVRRVWRTLNQHEQRNLPSQPLSANGPALPRPMHATSTGGFLDDAAAMANHLADDGDYPYPAQASEAADYIRNEREDFYSAIAVGNEGGNAGVEAEEAENEFHGFWQPNILY